MLSSRFALGFMFALAWNYALKQGGYLGGVCSSGHSNLEFVES